jgi:hypothetical protein
MSIVTKAIISEGKRLNYQFHSACTHCEDVDQSPFVHLQKLISNTNSISVGEMHCLARATLASGDQQSAKCLAGLFLQVAGKGDNPKKREAENQPDISANEKKRATDARTAVALLLAKRVLVSADLLAAKDAIPQPRPDAPLPQIADVIAAVKTYVRLLVNIDPEAQIERTGAGIYLRPKNARTDAQGGHSCEVYLPETNAEGNVQFRLRGAFVNANGDITKFFDELAQPTPLFIPEDLVYQTILQNIRQQSTTSGIGFSFKLAPASSGLRLFPDVALAVSTIDFARISLVRFAFTPSFSDSYENNSGSKKLIDFLDALVVDNKNLGRGSDARNELRVRLLGSLYEFPSAEFVVTVTGGHHSTRTYTITPNDLVLPERFQIKLTYTPGLIDFSKFFDDVFPNQLFSEKEFTATSELLETNDENDFANTNYGRHLKIHLAAAEVNFQNVELALPALVHGTPELVAPQMGLDLTSASATNDAPRFDAQTAAEQFASAGSVELADGRLVELGNWTSVRDAKNVVAADDQVTGLADDVDDAKTTKSTEERLGEKVARHIKRARVLLKNLDVMAVTETLTIQQFASRVVEIFEETDQIKQYLRVVLQFTDPGNAKDDEYHPIKLTIDSGDYVSFNGNLPKQDVRSEEIRNFIFTNLTERFQRRTRVDDLVSATLILKAGENTAIRKFTGYHFCDLKTFVSEYTDTPLGVAESVMWIGMTHRNGFHFLSTQFPYDPRAALEVREVSAAQPMSDLGEEPSWRYEDMTGQFMLNGILYSSIRQFEEASRFEGFPDLQRKFYKPLVEGDVVYEDEEQRLCRAVIRAEEQVSAAGASLTRQKFHTVEFQHAVAQRIFQNPWMYKRVAALIEKDRNLKFYLIPRVVIRYNPQIGSDEYSIEETTCASLNSSEKPGLFYEAMEFVKVMIKRDAQKYEQSRDRQKTSWPLNQIMLLPAPLVRSLRGEFKEPPNFAALKVVFIASTERSYMPHVLFSTGFIQLRDDARQLCVTTARIHLKKDTKLLLDAETARYDCQNVISDYSAVFAVERGFRRYPDLPALYSATPPATLDFYPEIGSVTETRGVPSFVVEVSLASKKGTETVIFRSEDPLSIFFDPGEPVVKTFVLKNSPEVLTSTEDKFRVQPKEFVVFVSREDGDRYNIEGYRIDLPVTAKEAVNKVNAAQPTLTVDQKAVQQSTAHVRPHSAATEMAQDDISQSLYDIDKELEVLEASLSSSEVVSPPKKLLETTPEPVSPTEKAKKKVRFESPTEEQQLQAYVEEGDVSSKDEWGTPPPPVAPAPGAKKSRKATAVKRVPVAAMRFAVAQTGASLISAPLIVEISNHGYRYANKRVGYVERSEEELDQTTQAIFLHPLYPRFPGAMFLDEFDLEKLLNSVAKKFSSLMPRRSLVQARLLSEAKQKFLDAVDEMETGLKQPVLDKIEAAKQAYLKAKKEKKLGADALGKMETKYQKDAERMLKEVQERIEMERAKMYAAYNVEMKKKPQKAAKLKAVGTDDDDGSGDDEFEDPEDEALAYFLEKEGDFETAPDYADSDFIIEGERYKTLTEYFIDKFTDAQLTPASFDRFRAAIRQRVMQNRALYDAILDLKKRVLKTTNQAKLTLIPSVGKGLFASEEEGKLARLLDLLSSPNTSEKLLQKTTRINLSGVVTPVNVAASVALIADDKVTALLVDRAAFFQRTDTLRKVARLTTPVREVGVKQADGATQTHFELEDVAVAAARELYDSQFANIDFCVLEDTTDVLTISGLLIGGFIDSADTKTHVFEIAGMEALNEEAAARLLDYAEHALKYSDPTKGKGRKKSTAVGLNVIGSGFRVGSNTPSALAIERVLKLRGYDRVEVEMGEETVWTLNADLIVDRLHYVSDDFFGSAHLGWIEDDVVSEERWNFGDGRFFPLIVNKRLVEQVVTDENDVQSLVPIYVWRAAPQPLLVPLKAENPLQSQLASLGVIEPMTYLVVKCYSVGKDGRKLLYATPPAPDWIKLNNEIALLPFENDFRRFARTQPEVFEEKKNLDNDIVNSREQTLKDNLENLLMVVESRRQRGGVQPTGIFGEQRLVGATEAERERVQQISAEIRDLQEKIKYANNTKSRKESSTTRPYFDDYHFIDWAPNTQILAEAVIEIAEPRYASIADVPPHSKNRQGQDIVLAQLENTWANIDIWKPKSELNPDVPLNRQFEPRVKKAAQSKNEPDWRQNSLADAETNRWRSFFGKYTPPQPYTTLEAMLVLAHDSAYEIVFEIEEQTFVANEMAPPVVIFRSEAMLVSEFFDEEIPYSSRLRVRRLENGELDSDQAELQVTEDETLEDFEGNSDVFIRTLTFDNVLKRDDIVQTPALLYPVRQTKSGNSEENIGLVATVTASNYISSFHVEFNNNLEVSDLQPERCAIGAFFIDSEPLANVSPKIVVADKPLEELKLQSRIARAQSINTEHFVAAETETESEDEDFEPEEGEEEEEEESEASSSEEETMPLDEMLTMFKLTN